VDFAPLRCALVEAPSPQAATLVLALDHLRTPKPASRPEACAPVDARRILARLAIHDTHTPGSWLPMAETALRVLATPSWDRRIADPTRLTPEVSAWERQRNTAKCQVEWQFTTREASIKRKRLSPSMQLG